MENYLMIGHNVRLLKDIETADGVQYSKHSIARIMPDLSFYCLTGHTQGYIMESVEESAIDRVRRVINYQHGIVNRTLVADKDYKLLEYKPLGK